MRQGFHRPRRCRPVMHAAQGRRQSRIGQAAQQAGRGRCLGRGAQRLDHQHFQQVGQHDIARRPVGARFPVDQVQQGRQPSLAAHMDQRRQQGGQKRGIRRTEAAIADQLSRLRRPIAANQAENTRPHLDRRVRHARRRRVAIEAHGRKALRERDKGKITLGKNDRFKAVDRQAKRALKHRAVERAPRLTAAHRPGPRAFDQLDEGGAGLQQIDDFSERIGQIRTFTKLIWTFACNTSGAACLSFGMQHHERCAP